MTTLILVELEAEICPFCKGEDLTVSSFHKGFKEQFQVFCSDCNAAGPTEPNPNEAVISWNNCKQMDRQKYVDAINHLRSEDYNGPLLSFKQKAIEAIENV